MLKRWSYPQARCELVAVAAALVVVAGRYPHLSDM